LKILKTAISFVLLAVLVLGAAGCGTTIQPGHVGIVVDKFGANRGVQDYTIRSGWVSYNPWSSWVIEYPVFVQTVQWTRSTNEGNPYDESITFTTNKSVKINADISLSYQLAPESVPAFYVKFRNSQIKDFTYGYMHNIARDAMMEIGGHYTVEQVMGDNEQFLHDVRDRISLQLKDIGITINQFGFIGAPRPPEAITEQINRTTQADYLAQQKAQADAAKRVAAAEGEQRSNLLLTQSLTPQVLEFQRIQLQRQQLEVQDRWINRWNGQMPQVTSGSSTGMLYTLPTPKQ
jgi:regulator of protease activity HflC (stomatin/prohibitin superfamily)